MKKLVTLLMVFSIPANAVVIIPPVVYFISVSLATFFANALVAIVGWAAVQGFSEKVYGGKTAFEIGRFAFSCIGKAIMLIAAMAFAVTFFPPFDLTSAAVTGAAAASAALVFLSLSKARRLLVEKEKSRLVATVVGLALFAGAVTTASSVLSLETTVVYRSADLTSTETAPATGFGQPFAGIAEIQPAQAKAMLPTAPSQEAAAPSKAKILASQLWFFPQNATKCNIYSDDALVLEASPAGQCFYPSGQQLVKAFCPVALTADKLGRQGRQVRITSTGSCGQYYDAIASQNGFEIKSSG